MPRCCSLCRQPGHYRTHCPGIAPLEPYSESVLLGMSLFAYLRAILLFASWTTIEITDQYSREQMRYSRLAHSYLGDSAQDLRERHPDLRIVQVQFSIVFGGHSGGCEDEWFTDDEDDGHTTWSFTQYVALPPGLVGDLSGIDVSQFEPTEHAQCWCHGSWQTWTVTGLEYV